MDLFIKILVWWGFNKWKWMVLFSFSVVNDMFEHVNHFKNFGRLLNVLLIRTKHKDIINITPEVTRLDVR